MSCWKFLNTDARIRAENKDILQALKADEAATKLPQLLNFAVYPTTLVLGRDGRVRHVHAGFASAATGEEHVRPKREKRELIKRLLKEKPPVSRQAGDGRP